MHSLGRLIGNKYKPQPLPQRAGREGGAGRRGCRSVNAPRPEPSRSRVPAGCQPGVGPLAQSPAHAVRVISYANQVITDINAHRASLSAGRDCQVWKDHMNQLHAWRHLSRRRGTAQRVCPYSGFAVTPLILFYYYFFNIYLY